MDFSKYPAVNLDRPDLKGKVTVASGPVIIENNRTLLVQHGEEKLWKFPGGSIHFSENFEETAIREVKEELDIDVQLEGQPFVQFFTREKEGTVLTVILIHYFARRLNDTIKAGSDIDKFEWFDVDNLPVDSHQNVPPVVKHFMELIRKS